MMETEYLLGVNMATFIADRAVDTSHWFDSLWLASIDEVTQLLNNAETQPTDVVVNDILQHIAVEDFMGQVGRVVMRDGPITDLLRPILNKQGIDVVSTKDLVAA